MKHSIFKRTDLIYWLFPILALIIGLVLMSLNVHGSSIGVYYRLLYGSSDPNLLFGEPRQIRIDEWQVTTPQLMSQARLGFPVINPKIGLGQNMAVFFDSPTRHWSTLFKPVNLISLVTPIDHLLSVRWWVRTVFFLLAFYLLGLVLTYKNIFLAIFLALFIYLSPFVQWWYTNPGYFVEMLTSFALIIVVLHFLKSSKTNASSLLLIFALSYLLVSFGLVMYPPFQIPLAILAVVIFLSWIYTLFKNNEVILLRRFVVRVSIAMVLASAVLGLFSYEFQEEFRILMHTEYPGSRMVEGGSWPPIYWLRGLFSPFLTNEARSWSAFLSSWVPNQSEGSGFLLIILPFIPVYFGYVLYNYWKNKKLPDPLLFGLSLYTLFFVFWFVVGLPGFIAAPLMLTKLPLKRVLIGMGIAEGLFIVHYFKFFKPPLLSIKYRFVSILLPMLYGSLILLNGALITDTLPEFIPDFRYVILIALFGAVSLWLFMQKRMIIFCTITLIFLVFTSIGVNPLYQGSDVIAHSAFEDIIRADPEAGWVVFETYDRLGSFIIASGGRSLTTTYLYPQRTLWEKFDPEIKYEEVWNRYAHVGFSSTTNTEIEFSLLNEDHFIVSIDPCHSIFDSLNVDYFVFIDEKFDSKCLIDLQSLIFQDSEIIITKRST
jgi:hypothetical protein